MTELTPVYYLPGYFPSFGSGLSDRPLHPRPPHQETEVIDTAGHPDAYRMKALCLNCNWGGQVRIPNGRRTQRTPGYDCPACKCATVQATTLAARDSEKDDSAYAMQRAKDRYEMENAEYERLLAEWEAKQAKKGRKR